MDRTILHCDLNAFFASVECLYQPELKKVPMAVCGSIENRRGIILAKNEPAKKYGIKTAETVWEAKGKCHGLVLVEPHHSRYQKYSRLVNKIYYRFTDRVEPFGIDESWLDVSGSTHLFGSGKEIADRIRKEVREELGLTISVGVSFNKIFAKLGSDYKKPDATTIIDRDNFREIVYPLPVSALLFVGEAAAASLSKLGIKTIGQLAASDKKTLFAKLGRMGEIIQGYARGLDEDPVASAHTEREVKSVGNGMTFKRNLLGLADINTAVSSLADLVATRLRKSGFKCTTVQVVIKDPQLKTISRQKGLPKATHLSREISNTAVALIKDNWDLKKPIRMLNITGMNLVTEGQPEQVCLFFDEDEEQREKMEKIEDTLDYIRERYGKKSISFGSNLNKDLGISLSEEDREKE